MPELKRLILADDPQAWERAGFAVEGNETVLGSVAVSFVEPDHGVGRGVVGWHLVAADESAPSSDGPISIDGIPTTIIDRDPARTPPSSPHANGVSRLDHVVINTTDLSRTIPALEGHGFEVRRHRDVPGSNPARRQVFLWAGQPILEVVGPAQSANEADRRGDDRARIWGLALTTDDLDGAVERLGPMVTQPKAAVQSGRRIATIDTKGLGIGIALALMTPHRARAEGRGRGDDAGH